MTNAEIREILQSLPGDSPFFNRSIIGKSLANSFQDRLDIAYVLKYCTQEGIGFIPTRSTSEYPSLVRVSSKRDTYSHFRASAGVNSP